MLFCPILFTYTECSFLQQGWCALYQDLRLECLVETISPSRWDETPKPGDVFNKFQKKGQGHPLHRFWRLFWSICLKHLPKYARSFGETIWETIETFNFSFSLKSLRLSTWDGMYSQSRPLQVLPREQSGPCRSSQSHGASATKNVSPTAPPVTTTHCSAESSTWTPWQRWFTCRSWQETCTVS